MGKITAGFFLRHLRRLVPGDRPELASDGELLRRYATQRDEAAFVALVHRHGPLVWNTCPSNPAGNGVTLNEAPLPVVAGEPSGLNPLAVFMVTP